MKSFSLKSLGGRRGLSSPRLNSTTRSNSAYNFQDQGYSIELLNDVDLKDAQSSNDENYMNGSRHLSPPQSLSPYTPHSASSPDRGYFSPPYTGDTLTAKPDDPFLGKGETSSVECGFTKFDMGAFPASKGHAYAALPRSARLLPQDSGIFERPRWIPLGSFILLCAISYPFLVLVAMFAHGRSLFWARAIVGIGVGILGVCIGYILLDFARLYLEASTWATVIHASQPHGGQGDGKSGIRLRDLTQHTSSPTSIYAALRLLKNRWSTHGTRHSVRGAYDRRPWSLFLLFFLLLVCLSSALPFIYGRIVSIEAITQQQIDEYDEIYVWGELSTEDLAGATSLTKAFESFVSTWTLAPFASLTNLPSAVSFKFGNDTVYLAESYAHQLREDGLGLGTYNFSAVSENEKIMNTMEMTKSNTDFVGLVQFPKWGIRIYCEKLPDPATYMVPMSTDGFTYIFVPDFFLETLFSNLSLPYPALLPKDLTKILSANDTGLSDSLDENSIVAAAKLFNNGVAHSFASSPADMGESGNGWVEIEILSVRLNTTYTPNGTFPTLGAALPDQFGKDTFIGYDAAVCVEAYEPWVVETLNATGVAPTSTRIVRRNDTLVDSTGHALSDGARKRHALDTSKPGIPEVQWILNSTGKSDAFGVAHDNSVNQMVKDNGRDFFYVPSPLLVSFTDGSGPTGYTELSAKDYARARAAADATNVLPFLAGSGALGARFFPSRVVSIVEVQVVPYCIATCILLAIGLAAGLCIPRLPLSVPRRGFDLLSWLAVLHGDNMIGQLPILPGGKSGIDEKMDLEDIEKRFGDVRVRYHA